MRLQSTLALVLGIVASTPTEAAMAQALAGSEWGPLALNSVAPQDEVEQFVHFGADGRLSGHAGCNRFTGTYAVDGDTLTVGPLATTRMMCPPPRMELEQALLAVFENVATFRRDGTRLALFDAAGDEIARFVQRDWD